MNLKLEFREDLKNDKHLINLVSYMLHSDKYKVGRFIDIHTFDEFIDKLLKANIEEVKYLPKRDLYMYRTSDLGFGYSSYISPNKLNEFIELGKVSKDIPIESKYKWGNVFHYINIEDIDDKLLLTDDIYFLIKKETKEIWDINIGKFTNPNFLYFRSDIEDKITTLDKLKILEYFNRINIREKYVKETIDCDIF